MSTSERPSAFRFGDLEFDPETGEISGGDTPQRLARQPALVLEALLEQPGELLTRAELIRRVWQDGHHVDYDQSLNFCVREVRRALGDEGRGSRFVETLPKRGYRFVAEVSVSSRSAGHDGCDSMTAPTTERVASPRPRPWVLAAAVAGALLAGTALGHDVARSPAHARAVSWFHGLVDLAGHSCPWAS